MAAKVTFVSVAADGRFQFHTGDGAEQVVDKDGYTTDDPHAIAYLDECPFVKRAKAKDD